MNSLVVTPKSPQELAFLTTLFKKMNIKAKEITLSEQQDMALGKAIDEGMMTRSVSRNTVFKNLQR